MSATNERSVPLGLLLTATTGRLLARGKFVEFANFCEWLLGCPIFTHQFASADLAAKIKDAVLSQHPFLPSDMGDVTPENWPERLAALEAKHGEYLITRSVGGMS